MIIDAEGDERAELPNILGTEALSAPGTRGKKPELLTVRGGWGGGRKRVRRNGNGNGCGSMKVQTNVQMHVQK